MRIAGLILAGWGLAELTAGGGGYLPRIGPSPIRFMDPPRSPVPLPVLLSPEPASTETPAVTEPTPPSESAQVIPPNPPPETPVATPLEPANPPAPPVPVGSDPQPALTTTNSAAAFVSPQMLLHFFRASGSTNGTDRVLTVPLQFNPPQTSNPASSKATYQTP